MPKLSGARSSDTVFNIWINRADAAYDAMLFDMAMQIRTMRALGISDQEIFDRLSTSLNNDMGLFQSLRGLLESITDEMIFTTSQMASNSIFEGDNELLVWELDPTAREHCPDCLKNSEKAGLTFDQWQEIGLPGFGNTECESYCKCTLVTAGSKT